jgi:RNA polymerase primary sigma factor
MISRNSQLDQRRKRHRSAVSTRGSASKARVGLSPADEQLLRLILSEPMDFMDNPEFAKPGAEKRIYRELPEIQRPDVSWYRPLLDDLTPASERGRDRARPRGQTSILLTGAQERVLFLKYNFARRAVKEIQDKLGTRRPTLTQSRTILRWYRVAKAYREQIAETNLALVLAMAKRTRLTDADLADMISEGNMALLRSVDKFDCARGFKFSTYACRAILKAFSRQGMKTSKYRQHFPTDFDPAMEKSNYLEILRDTHEKESAAEVKHIVLNNRADLSDIERAVIDHRFALTAPANSPPLTLEQVGRIIGVTKERVRQIQNKALEKIRLALESRTPVPSQPLPTAVASAAGTASPTPN